MNKLSTLFVISLLLAPTTTKPFFNDPQAVGRFLATAVACTGLYMWATEPSNPEHKRDRDSLFFSLPMFVGGTIVATGHTQQALMYSQQHIVLPFLNYLAVSPAVPSPVRSYCKQVAEQIKHKQEISDQESPSAD